MLSLETSNAIPVAVLRNVVGEARALCEATAIALGPLDRDEPVGDGTAIDGDGNGGGGGSLLEGTFDEAASAASFADAVQAWREGN